MSYLLLEKGSALTGLKTDNLLLSYKKSHLPTDGGGLAAGDSSLTESSCCTKSFRGSCQKPGMGRPSLVYPELKVALAQTPSCFYTLFIVLQSH